MHNTICLAIAACIVGMGATAEPSSSSNSLPEDPTKQTLRVQEPAYDTGENRVGPFNFELLDRETGEVVSEKVIAAADAMLSTSGLPSSSKRVKMSYGVGPSAGKAQEIPREDPAETILPRKGQYTKIFNKRDANTQSTLRRTPEAGTKDKGKAKFRERESVDEDKGTALITLLQKYMVGKEDPGAVFSAVRSGLPGNVFARKELVNEWAKYVDDYLKDNPMELNSLFQKMGNEGDVVRMLYSDLDVPRNVPERKILLTYLHKSWLEPKLCDPADIYKRLGLNTEPINFDSKLFREWVFHARYLKQKKESGLGFTYAPTLVKFYGVEGVYAMLNQAKIMLEQGNNFVMSEYVLKLKLGKLKLIASDLKSYLQTQEPKYKGAAKKFKALIESLQKKGASGDVLKAPKLNEVSN